jgi:hypothetical protein
MSTLFLHLFKIFLIVVYLQHRYPKGDKPTSIQEVIAVLELMLPKLMFARWGSCLSPLSSPSYPIPI